MYSIVVTAIDKILHSYYVSTDGTPQPTKYWGCAGSIQNMLAWISATSVLWGLLCMGFCGGRYIMRVRWVIFQLIMLRSGLVYGLTGAFLVRRQFFLHWSRYCWCRYCVRLGPSDGREYMVGTEDFSGQNQGLQTGRRRSLCSRREEWDWEVEWLMQLFRVQHFKSLIDLRTQT